MTELQKQKQRKENVLKLKKIGFWTINIISYICAFLFVLLLIISLVSPKQSSNGTSPRNIRRSFDNDIVLVEDNPNYVSYDDEGQIISLSADELNNITFINLANTLNDSDNGIDLGSSDIDYGDNTLIFTDYAIEDSFSYTFDTDQAIISFQLDNNYRFTLLEQNELVSFGFGINWYIDDIDSYDFIKSAIELDIQANSNPTPTIFESITQVITNFINTLNEGVQDVIELFWDSENLSLTMLGNLTTIVVGVAVCFFLFRLLIGLIRLRG